MQACSAPLPANLPAANADCSNLAALVQQETSWDPNRTRMDPTGYVGKVLGVMPQANNYRAGDGLNTGGFQWTLTQHGIGTANRFAFGAAEVREQANIRIDHNFDSKNKINGGWTYERNHADYGQGGGPQQFPGVAHNQPQILNLNFTSTLSPSLLNEVPLRHAPHRNQHPTLAGEPLEWQVRRVTSSPTFKEYPCFHNWA